MLVTNYSNGYIVEYERKHCFHSWLLIPGENLWPDWVKGLLYTIAILYIFLGIAIAADTFMLSIEIITSKKRIIFTFDYETKKRVEREVFVWNETIANLTLMALGSSAPEILIAVIETVSTLEQTAPVDGLGIFTIVGSASYNLLVISAVCIISVPGGASKQISEFGVFVVTSIWSLFAYVWLMVVLQWSSPGIVDIWEAVLTLSFFLLLVLTAWGQDRGWWILNCKKMRSNSGNNRHTSGISTKSSCHIVDMHSVNPVLHNQNAVEETPSRTKNASFRLVRTMTQSRSKLREIVNYVKDHDRTDKITAEDVVDGLRSHFDSSTSKAFARARFRHAVVTSITGMKRRNSCPKKNKLISKALESEDKREKATAFPYIIGSTNDEGTFCFSSGTYSVSKTSNSIHIDVLFNRRRRKSSARHVGFSHIVDSARQHLLSSEGLSSTNDSVVSTSLGSKTDDSQSLAEVNDFKHLYVETFDDTVTHQKKKESDGDERLNGILYKKTEKCQSNPLQPSTDHPLRELTPDQLSKEYDGNSRNGIISPIDSSNTNYNVVEENSMNGNAMATDVVMVCYETREGNAKHKKDFVASTGTLVFSVKEYHKSITIPVVENSKESGEKKDFYVLLKNPCPDTSLGDPSIAHVSLIDDNEPGEFLFEDPTYHIQYSQQGFARACANVVRLHGCDGKATVFYRTIDGTACGGGLEDLSLDKCDFEHAEKGILNFSAGETSKKITVRVNGNAEKGKTFIIVLSNVSGSTAKIGHRSAAIISLTSDVDQIVDQVTSIMDKQEDNLTLTQTWKEQITESMVLDGKPSSCDMMLHFLCFFWKVILSFIPPRTLWGGWPTFIVSLAMLGVLSGLIEQLAKLLGCIIDLHVSVTGITLVALGTSMPDTFASKTAALQDDTADAAIGNVTGSNCVNVFLGLGLPWVIKSVYLHYAKNAPLRIVGGNVLFSVVVFLVCGVVALLILVFRRVYCKGELGGSKISKWVSGLTLIMLWFLFVLLSSLRAYGIISGF